MAGTAVGAQKARETNLRKYGPDFYKEIGARSWDDPFRSRKTGFALLSHEIVVELGKRGGKQNKGKKYKKHGKETNPVKEPEETGSGPL